MQKNGSTKMQHKQPDLRNLWPHIVCLHQSIIQNLENLPAQTSYKAKIRFDLTNPRCQYAIETQNQIHVISEYVTTIRSTRVDTQADYLVGSKEMLQKILSIKVPQQCCS